MPPSINQSAENSNIDLWNPLEVAGAGIRKSVEMLRAMLRLKEQRMAMLTPSEGKSKDQLNIARESVSKRQLLAQEISLV